MRAFGASQARNCTYTAPASMSGGPSPAETAALARRAKSATQTIGCVKDSHLSVCLSSLGLSSTKRECAVRSTAHADGTGFRCFWHADAS